MPEKLTDEEVICEWIGKTPRRGPLGITLDYLHEVEARLTDEQWNKYKDLLIDDDEAISGYFECRLIHATAAQKIAALAAVIRAAKL